MEAGVFLFVGKRMDYDIVECEGRQGKAECGSIYKRR
jgi:hypothetical protein